MRLRISNHIILGNSMIARHQHRLPMRVRLIDTNLLSIIYRCARHHFDILVARHQLGISHIIFRDRQSNEKSLLTMLLLIEELESVSSAQLWSPNEPYINIFLLL